MNYLPKSFICHNCKKFTINNGDLDNILLKSFINYREYNCLKCFVNKKCNCYNCNLKRKIENNKYNEIYNPELLNI